MSVGVFCPSCAQDTLPIRGACGWCDTVLDSSVAPIPVGSVARVRRVVRRSSAGAHTRESLIREILRWRDETGDWPKSTDWQKTWLGLWPTYGQVIREFRSWKVAIRQAQLALEVEEAVAA